MVGVRFNLVSYEPDALTRPEAPRLLQRLGALGWFAQVYADDTQWPDAARVLKASGVHVLVDHFGIRDIRRGIDDPGSSRCWRSAAKVPRR
jgi:predicted TIM-barrel fold metal-dependent hydrolase